MAVTGLVKEDSNVRADDRGDVAVMTVKVAGAVKVAVVLGDGDNGEEGDSWAVSSRQRWLLVRGGTLETVQWDS